MKERFFNLMFWIVPISLLILVILTFSIANSNEKRRKDYEDNRLKTLTSIREAVKDIKKDSDKQHTAQDKKFECLIALFITWTNNGQQPITEKEARACTVKDKTKNKSSQSATPKATSPSKKTTPPSDSGGGTKKPATKEVTEDEIDEGIVPDDTIILGPIL